MVQNRSSRLYPQLAQAADYPGLGVLRCAYLGHRLPWTWKCPGLAQSHSQSLRACTCFVIIAETSFFCSRPFAWEKWRARARNHVLLKKNWIQRKSECGVPRKRNSFLLFVVVLKLLSNFDNCVTSATASVRWRLDWIDTWLHVKL